MENWQLVLAVSGMLIGFGILLLFVKDGHEQVIKHWQVIVGLVFVLPVITVLSTTDSIDSNTVSMLLGAVVGFFFRIRQDDQTAGESTGD